MIYKNEKSDSVCIVMTILGLEMHEGNFNCFSFGGGKEPSNARFKQSITDSSVEFKIIVESDSRKKSFYKWEVKRLPSKIRPEKTKVKVSFKFLVFILYFK